MQAVDRAKRAEVLAAAAEYGVEKRGLLLGPQRSESGGLAAAVGLQVQEDQVSEVVLYLLPKRNALRPGVQMLRKLLQQAGQRGPDQQGEKPNSSEKPRRFFLENRGDGQFTAGAFRTGRGIAAPGGGHVRDQKGLQLQEDALQKEVLRVFPRGGQVLVYVQMRGL